MLEKLLIPSFYFSGVFFWDFSECFECSGADTEGFGCGAHQPAAKVAGGGRCVRYDGVRALRHL